MPVLVGEDSTGFVVAIGPSLVLSLVVTFGASVFSVLVANGSTNTDDRVDVSFAVELGGVGLDVPESSM